MGNSVGPCMQPMADKASEADTSLETSQAVVEKDGATELQRQGEDPAEAEAVNAEEGTAKKQEEEDEKAAEVKPTDAEGTKVEQVVIVFEHKGVRKVVEFLDKQVGFEYVQTGTGCCAGKSTKSVVKVSKLAANQRAVAMGVPRGAIIRQINDKDVADANQFHDLLAGALSLLPDAVAAPVAAALEEKSEVATQNVDASQATGTETVEQAVAGDAAPLTQEEPVEKAATSSLGGDSQLAAPAEAETGAKEATAAPAEAVATTPEQPAVADAQPEAAPAQ